MNVIGLLIGIGFWALILTFFPDLPTLVRTGIAVIMVILFLTILSRVYRYLITRRTE